MCSLAGCVSRVCSVARCASPFSGLLALSIAPTTMYLDTYIANLSLYHQQGQGTPPRHTYLLAFPITPLTAPTPSLFIYISRGRWLLKLRSRHKQTQASQRERSVASPYHLVVLCTIRLSFPDRVPKRSFIRLVPHTSDSPLVKQCYGMVSNLLYLIHLSEML